MNQYINELLKYFHTKQNDLVKAMSLADHNFDRYNLNPYHLEGDVWTHTMMVLRKAEELNYNKSVILGSILHDVGKHEAMFRNKEKQRVSFTMHEQLSAFRSIEILKDLNTSKKDIEHLFKMICLHTDLFRLSDKNFDKYLEKYRNQKRLLQDLICLGTADALGRIVDETISPQKDAVKKMQELTQELIDKIDTSEVTVDTSKHQAIVLVGLPMSGKSTFVKSLDSSYRIVSRDEILLDLSNGKNYDEAFKTMDVKLVNNLLNNKIDELVKNQRNIVFDMTNMSRKRRKSLSRRLKDRNYQVHAKVFLTDEKTLESRNDLRSKNQGKSISQEVLLRMKKSFHPPMYDVFDTIDYEVN